MRARTTGRPQGYSWKEIAYYIMAGLWVVSAIYSILQGTGIVPSAFFSIGGGEYLVVVGVIDLAFGIGLLLQNDFIMYIVKFRCIIGLLSGLLGLVFAAGMRDPTTMAVGIIVNVLYLAFTGMQIYLLSEFSDT